MCFKNRFYTVSSIFTKSQSKVLTRNNNFFVKPKISITGNWLNDAGFKIGDKIRIEVEENKIVIYNEI